MKRAFQIPSLLSVAVLLGVMGCNDRSLESGASTTPPDPPVVQSADVCLTDGTFDFHVSGSGFATWNGKAVVAAALEHSTDFSNPNNPQHSQRVPVRLGTHIAAGSFSIMCPTSLRENYEYPSYALYIDVDGDGRCGIGDVGMEQQLYGWNNAIDDQLPVDAHGAQFLAVNELQPAIGGAQGATFCQDYFP